MPEKPINTVRESLPRNGISLSLLEQRILEALARRYPDWISAESVADDLLDDPSLAAASMDARRVRRSMAEMEAKGYLRTRLAPAGVVLARVWSDGLEALAHAQARVRA